MFKKTTIAMVGMATLFIGFAPASAAEKTIRFGLFFSERANVVKKVLIPWARWFEKQSGGTVAVKFFFSGALGRSPTKQYKLVRSGIMDVAFVVPSYTPGTFPDFDIFQAPNMAQNATEGSYAVTHMLKAGLIRNLDKVVVLGTFTTGAYAIHTNREIKSLSDLRGLKLRAGGKVQNEMVTALGATPVGMSVSKIAENISRGLLEGSVSEWNAADTFKILKVTKTHFHTALGVLPIMVVMNKRVYNKLPAKAKAAIPAGRELMAKLQGAASDEATAKAIAQIKGDKGKAYISMSAADRKKMDALFGKITADLKKKVGDKRWQAYVDALKQVRKSN